MKFLSNCNNIDCFKIFSNSLKLMCEGEISQHFTKGKLPTMEEYIEKSKKKTAELFIASLTSLCKITNKNEENALNFATNFGIAFQIKDDLKNILETDLFQCVAGGILRRAVLGLGTTMKGHLLGGCNHVFRIGCR